MKRNTMRKRALVLLIALGLMGALLTACGNDNNSTPSPQNPQNPQNTPSNGTESTPDVGDKGDSTSEKEHFCQTLDTSKFDPSKFDGVARIVKKEFSLPVSIDDLTNEDVSIWVRISGVGGFNSKDIGGETVERNRFNIYEPPIEVVADLDTSANSGKVFIDLSAEIECDLTYGTQFFLLDEKSDARADIEFPVDELDKTVNELFSEGYFWIEEIQIDAIELGESLIDHLGHPSKIFNMPGVDTACWLVYEYNDYTLSFGVGCTGVISGDVLFSFYWNAAAWQSELTSYTNGVGTLSERWGLELVE